MSGNELSLHLLSKFMGDGDDAYFRRQGFWLRMARERAGKNQSGAAEQIGLAATSKSTISDYENGVQQAPQQVLRTLARWYGVPVDLFQRPPMTTDDVIEARLAAASLRGEAAELRDWEEEQDPSPKADDAPDVGRDTLLELVQPRLPR